MTAVIFVPENVTDTWIGPYGVCSTAPLIVAVPVAAADDVEPEEVGPDDVEPDDEPLVADGDDEADAVGCELGVPAPAVGEPTALGAAARLAPDPVYSFSPIVRPIVTRMIANKAVPRHFLLMTCSILLDG